MYFPRLVELHASRVPTPEHGLRAYVGNALKIRVAPEQDLFDLNYPVKLVLEIKASKLKSDPVLAVSYLENPLTETYFDFLLTPAQLNQPLNDLPEKVFWITVYAVWPGTSPDTWLKASLTLVEHAGSLTAGSPPPTSDFYTDPDGFPYTSPEGEYYYSPIAA